MTFNEQLVIHLCPVRYLVVYDMPLSDNSRKLDTPE